MFKERLMQAQKLNLHEYHRKVTKENRQTKWIVV
jgi:hypothetical protein